MQEINREIYQKYKQYEDKWNQEIHKLVNCPYFIYQMEKMLQAHLNDVHLQRIFVNHWLEKAGVPTKEELAAAAKKFISNEHKADHLEDMVYRLTLSGNKNKQSLAAVKESLQYVKQELKMEYSNIKIDRMKTIKNSLSKLIES